MKMHKIDLGRIKISNDSPLIFIAGNCVIESEKSYIQTVKTLKNIFLKIKAPFIAKASFDKANRTSIDSFRGPGIKKGLEILKNLKKELDIKVLVDIHLPNQADEIAEVADIIQIPAFLSRQTDLIIAAADTGKCVNIKKGQFLSPNDMENAIKKIESRNNKKILLTERGSCFGYSNLIVDMRSLEIMKNFGYPVIFDATHSVQKPGALGKSTGGDKNFIFPLAKAATALKIAGIFFETHQNPSKALSDGSNSIKLSQAEDFAQYIYNMDRFVKSQKEVRI